MNYTKDFAQYLYSIANRKNADDDLLKCKHSLLDYLGAAVAGMEMQRSKITTLLKFLQSDSGICTVIGTGIKMPPPTAALINGICAHVAEMDDGTRFGMMHPGAPVFSALLAIAEQKNLDSNGFYRGVITGYEAAIRLSSAIQPGHKEKGFHATGTCGSVGAACGVVAALGGELHEMEAAIAAAATGAGGLLKAIDDNSEMKPLNVGRAAENGLVAAYAALSGFIPPRDVLGSPRGVFEIFAKKFSPNMLIPSGNMNLAIYETYMKPYAACRHCHPAIEAALELVRTHGISFESIEGISVETYKWAVAGHDHVVVDSICSAKMSIPFSVASALVCRSGGMEAFYPDMLIHPEVVRLTGMVSVHENPVFTGLVPGKRPARVSISTTDGIFTAEVNLPKGEPETALQDDEVREKFRSLCSFAGMTSDAIDDTIRKVYSFEYTVTDILNSLRVV